MTDSRTQATRRHHAHPTLSAAVAGLLLAGCCSAPAPPVVAAPRLGLRVVLLPESDRPASAVVIAPAGAPPVTLDKPYELAEAPASASAPLKRRQADAAEIQRTYGDLLANRPPPAQIFAYPFGAGSDQVPAALTADLATLRAAFEARPGAEVVVIGHTDATGAASANDGLSARRAAAVREMLIQSGWAAERISAVGRGSREPQVEAPAGRPEPRNRRVEVKLR